MAQTSRPRVAAIGLSDAQLESIAPLCGELRHMQSLESYLQEFDWIETDIVIAEDLEHYDTAPVSNLMVLGQASVHWKDTFQEFRGWTRYAASTDVTNTERELSVPDTCPEVYRTLSLQLSNQLMKGDYAPAAVTSSRGNKAAIIETTSGKPVGMRIQLPPREVDAVPTKDHPVALFLPKVPNLRDWFVALLTDLHESDPDRVPQQPPRLSKPSDWYTPEERDLSAQIEKASADIDDLVAERERLQTDLAEAGETGNRGVRRAIWADGKDLVAAVSEILSDLGFEVQNMDDGLQENEQKHEDLRLTLQDRPGWEAIVEVKGYANGTRTNDARQIREHRDHYIAENGRPPDLTLWLANPFRQLDPSSRPAPSSSVGDAAANIGAVHALATDLYRLWVLVQTGDLSANDAVQDLIEASLGLWSPSALEGNA